MWKKLENFAGARPDPSSHEASSSDPMPEGTESLEDPWLIGKTESVDAELEENSSADAVNEEIEWPKQKPESTPPMTLGAYTEAVNKFTKSASAFIEHLPLLAEARQAYEEATKASAELRRVLDAGDANLRALMSHLEQMANVHLGPTGTHELEKKNGEPSKLGPVRVGEEAKGAMKRFP